MCLWVGYLGACTAGLAVLGHAAAIVRSSGGSENESLSAVIVIGFATGLGGVAAGWLNDRYGYKRLLILLPGLTAGVLIFIALVGGQLVIFWPRNCRKPLWGYDYCGAGGDQPALWNQW